MTFRIGTSTQGGTQVIAFEGHLDGEALTAIAAAREQARPLGIGVVVQLGRGSTIERGVLASLAAWQGVELVVESPFLRACLAAARGQR